MASKQKCNLRTESLKPLWWEWKVYNHERLPLGCPRKGSKEWAMGRTDIVAEDKDALNEIIIFADNSEARERR